MKEKIINSIKILIKDRYLLVLLTSLLLMAVIFSIILAFSIKPSERQLIAHYSSYGVTHFYFEQWYYLFVFLFFGLISSLLHIIISIKLLVVKNRSIAIMVAWIGYGVIFFSWATVSKILELQALL